MLPWLADGEARAWAALGNANGARDAIARAERAWDTVRADEMGGIATFSRTRHLYFAADALIASGTVGGGAVGGEVGEQLGAPGARGAAQARDVGDGAGQGVVDDLFGAGAAGGGVLGGVGGHEVLGDAPGGGDLTVRVGRW
jgi:hypothetical protein